MTIWRWGRIFQVRQISHDTGLGYTREITDFKVFYELSLFTTQIVSLSLREVDYLILFEFCGMQNVEKL